MIFVSIYAVLSAIGFVVDLVHQQWVAMFCVAVYSACAYRGGEDLYRVLKVTSFTRKLGHAIFAVLLIAFAFYLARGTPIHLVYTTASGRDWVILGIIVLGGRMQQKR